MLRRQSKRYKSKYEKVGVLSIRIVKSNVSSIVREKTSRRSETLDLINCNEFHWREGIVFTAAKEMTIKTRQYICENAFSRELFFV